jgi:hypothetical protein
MTKLTERKTRLLFETEGAARYRGKVRAIVVEPDMHGWTLALRLKGTQVCYETSWGAVFDLFAKLHADRVRYERQMARKGTPVTPASRSLPGTPTLRKAVKA